ncbi:hypothetical protein E2562_024349 [Oryza meyeriana var. granulata]|uniref:CRIB domain-containing protein n=1 Tax=Oryza meyeriana var. granulata TaxID=110450 RepID=A0A6G1C8L5_9ORYZ|nr:hypothetical protein E2562_024349 [Oryza meyeriana var. granulata]
MTTEVALLRGPTNLASPTSRASSSSLRYLANGDSDVLPRRSSRESPTGSTGLRERREQEGEGSEEERWSFLALLLELLRKSLFGCRTESGGDCGMEIGWPTDVQHVAHVTFDRFHGFLGLPVELEPEVPRRAPSASASVFGVSTESMQCSYDSRGISVPTILLMMQTRLYEQGGLWAEGIFRINAENSQEEFVRDQLNSGIVPDGIDIHCLSVLIKINKMNARNIAMVFAPNMTQMSDPLTALMYAVQVMNFLKMLIQKTLKGRQESNLEDTSLPHKDPSDESGHHKPCLTLESLLEEGSGRSSFVQEEPILNSPAHDTGYKPIEANPVQGKTAASIVQTSEVQTFIESSSSCSRSSPIDPAATADPLCAEAVNSLQRKGSRSLNSRRTRKGKGQSGTSAIPSGEKSKGASIVSRINSKIERIEAWR